MSPQDSTNFPQGKLRIIEIPISELLTSIYNPRAHDRQAIEQVKESIRRFGVVDPLIVNGAPERKNIIIGGHLRLKALTELGQTSVPVVYVNIPDIEKEKELNLRLNRNVGKWDYEMLKEFDVNFLMDIGFDDSDLSTIWDSSLETEDDGFDTEKELAKIKTTDIKLGDKFQLGPHVLLCGDSTILETVKHVVGTETIQFITVDSPFNINLSYSDGIGTNNKYGGTKTNDNLSDANFEIFMRSLMSNSLAVASKDAHAFFWCDESYVWLLQKLFIELGMTNRRICTWVKNNASPTPKIAFSKATEFCVYATRGKPYLDPNIRNLNEIMNKEVGSGNRTIEDILDCINLWLVKRLPANEYIHPTQKDPTLYEKMIRRCTKVGDGVLELCGGSGSVLVACHQLKRRAFVIEIDPIFVQLIINRYESLTNDKAVKLN